MTIRLERSYLQIPYRAVRTPLGLFDELVVVRVFGAESSAHRIVAQGLQQLDTLAESAFGHSPGAPPAPTGPATMATTAPAEPIVTAPAAKSPAAKSPDEPSPDEPSPDEPSPDEPSPVEPSAGAAPIPAEEQEEIEQLADAFVAEQDLAPRAGELAENDEIRRVQAEIRAKQAVEDDRGQI